MQNQSRPASVKRQRVLGYFEPVNSKKALAGTRQRPGPNRRPSERKLVTGGALGRGGAKPHFSRASSTPAGCGRRTGATSVGRTSSWAGRLGAASGGGDAIGAFSRSNSSPSCR